MPFGCYAVCHTACSSYGIRHGSYLCPSCHFIHFVLRSASLHLVRSYANCFKAWHPALYTKAQHSGNAHAFSQSHAIILTGFHFASLRPPFISVAFSPPAAHYLACLAACHSCGFVMVFEPRHKLEANQKTTPNPCILSSCQPPLHGFCCHHCGRRTQPLPVVPPSSGFLSARKCRQRFTADKCAAGLCFFLAAGAITFFANAQGIHLINFVICKDLF